MSETFSNNLINGTIYHLLNFEKYPSFQQAAKQAAINNNFQIVLFSSDFNVVFSVETRHTVSIEDAVRTRLDNADFDKERKGKVFRPQYLFCQGKRAEQRYRPDTPLRREDVADHRTDL